MQSWMTWLFWMSFAASVYSYVLYPLLLLLVRSRSWKPSTEGASLPAITLIVTAYNESARIREKIRNTLELEYPRLELIVASDCSTDDTDAIVREYSVHGVHLVRAEARLGKENAQLAAIRESRGEVLVFSDVATQIPPKALQVLGRYFSMPGIGAVSSEDRFTSPDGKVAGEGAYVRYEMWLRRLESARAGLVGLSGSFFAARKVVCADWDIESPSDFNTALNCARRRLRAVSAPDVLGFYKDLKDPRKEYERKVRTVLRGMTAISRHYDVLNPFRYGLFCWQVWSHKMMRWSVPLCLLVLLLSTALLVSKHWFFSLALAGQVAFYGAALVAHQWPAFREYGPVRLIYFFVQVNVAIVDAFIRLCRGRRMSTWQPSAR